MPSEPRAAGRPRRLPSCLAPIGLALLLVAGCGYGEVSPTAYQYAKSLYAVSNRQASELLDGLQQEIVAATQRGEVLPKESGWLLAIVEDCRRDRWERANRAARRLMEDQIRR